MRRHLSLAFLLIANLVPCSQAAEDLLPWSAIEPIANAYVAGEYAPSVVIAIAKDGTLEVRGFGAFAPGSDRKVDGDTLYEIGSISKVFTGILFADAITRGEVKLDDTVQSFAPKSIHVPDQKPPAITLEHLSTHSSALPRLPPNFAPKDPMNPYAEFDASRLWAGLDASVIGRAPGSKYEYSNFAAGLLGLILYERAKVDDYDALLADRILKPLGMGSTRVTLSEKDRARLAPPFRADLVPDANWDLGALAGAGGIRSSGNDMLRLIEAVIARRDDAIGKALALSIEPRFTDSKSKVTTCLGWHKGDDDIVWHNGQTGGYHSFAAVSPGKRAGIVVLSNSASGELDRLANWALQRVLGLDKPAPEFPIPARVSDDSLEKLVGRYDFGLFAALDVTLDRDGKSRPRGLYAQLTGQPAFRVFPRSATEFAYRGIDATLTFSEIAERAGSVVLVQDGQSKRAKRVAK